MGSRVVVEHDRGKVIFPLYSPCIYTSHLPVYLFYRHLEGYMPEKMANAEDSPSSASRHRLCRPFPFAVLLPTQTHVLSEDGAHCIP